MSLKIDGFEQHQGNHHKHNGGTGAIHMAHGGKVHGHFIQKAIKHPGAERNAAKKAGMSTHAYMEEHKHDSGTAGKRARLGLTLEKMHH